MPIWIVAFFFLFGFLLIVGLAFVIKPPKSLTDIRLAQVTAARAEGAAVARQKGPGAAAAVRSSTRRTLRNLLFTVSEFLPVKSQSPKLMQRMAKAGFLGVESAQIFVGTRLVLAAGLFFFYNGLSFAKGPTGQTFLFSLIMVGLGFILPNVWLNRRITTRQKAIFRALPDFVDLLIICVEAGQGLDQALSRVGRELEVSHPIFSRELNILAWETRAGKSRAERLRNLYERSGVEDLKSFSAMLIQADRYGVSLSRSLRVFSETLRTTRRQGIEEAAQKTTIKIAIPLVLFIFPALMLIILGPAVLQLLAGMASQ